MTKKYKNFGILTSYSQFKKKRLILKLKTKK
jgi:hypothetical protein